METIGNYIVPAIRIMVDFLLLGVIARCTYILYMAWPDGDIQKAFQSIWKRILAGIIGICAMELVYAVAQIYGYTGAIYR